MLKLKEFYEKIPEIFKNKYFIVGFLFIDSVFENSIVLDVFLCFSTYQINTTKGNIKR